ncbi:hypothetical protein C8F01DRAFT_1300980, partial [Mycena amicta]
ENGADINAQGGEYGNAFRYQDTVQKELLNSNSPPPIVEPSPSSPASKAPSHTIFDRMQPSISHPVLLEDIFAWDEKMPIGGTLSSVHTPTHAAAWLAANPDLNFSKELPEWSAASGPFAYQLSSTEEVFMIFYTPNAQLNTLIHDLATTSGFPVILRPPGESPLFNQGLVQMERLRGGSSDASHSSTAQDILQKAVDAVKWKGKAKENSVREPLPTLPDSTTWQPKEHIANIEVALKDSEAKGRVKPSKQIDRTNQPRDCVMSTKVEVQLNNNHFWLDWSYTNMGFVVHRPDSISMCSMSVDPQYEDPQFTSKHTKEKNQSTTGGASLTISLKPSGGLSIQHTRGTKDIEERTDQMPKSKCRVSTSLGEEWNKHEQPFPQKDFRSWDLRWYPTSGAFGKPNNAIFGFDLELDLKHSSVMIWAAIPAQSTPKPEEPEWVQSSETPKMLGVMLVTSTYVPNVFTENAQETYESVQLDLHGDSDMISLFEELINKTGLEPLKTEPRTIADNYVAIARLPMAGTIVKQSRFTRFMEKLKLKKSVKEEKTHKLPLYEVILPREAITRQWMGPLWPSMNSQLQKLDSSSNEDSHNWVAWEQQPAKIHHIQRDPPAARPNQPPVDSSVATTVQTAGTSKADDRKTTGTNITTPDGSAIVIGKKST